MRYGDANTFARFWLHDADHTYYQECLNGLLSSPVDVGPSHAIDTAWHDWTVEVAGNANRLSIDGREICTIQTSNALVKKLSVLPVHVGFGAHDTYAAIDHVRVATFDE